MKKDVVYSLRINSKVRDALKKAAEANCRTMASLLDKIITDYLKDEGFLAKIKPVEERRQFKRWAIPLPSRTVLKTNENTDSIPSVVKDISMGGVKVVFPRHVENKITTSSMLTHFDLSVDFPNDNRQLTFNCNMRHVNKTDSEIQIGAAFENMSQEYLRQLKNYLR